MALDNQIWALVVYIVNVVAMVYTILLYVRIWNWMESEASEAEKNSIKLISLIPLVHFIALFQGLINRLFDFTSPEWTTDRYIVALFWLQAAFDFVQRITVGFMFGLNPVIVRQLRRRCCCHRSSPEEFIPFQP